MHTVYLMIIGALLALCIKQHLVLRKVDKVLKEIAPTVEAAQAAVAEAQALMNKGSS